MSDRYQQLTQSTPGRVLAKQLGLPTPTSLRRYEPGKPDLPTGPVALGTAQGGRLVKPTAETLNAIGADVRAPDAGDVNEPLAEAGIEATALNGTGPDERYAALVFDASGIASTDQLREAYAFFHPLVRKLSPCGRLLILATPPELADNASQTVAQRALEGFIRAVSKELRQGATGQLVYVAPGAESNLESSLRFFLSTKSAYVSGQVVRVAQAAATAPTNWDLPLDQKVAAVTGASRGIGESIAATLARDGAHVVCVDLPSQGDALTSVANRIGGSTLQLDITDENAPQALIDHLNERHGGLDVICHNAGITRDKTLARMDDSQWDSVIAVNLASQERITQALLAQNVLRANARVVCVSSTSGIAGNRGQVNYSTSKAGVIGLVQALAPELAGRQATINAVAPGFIETQMTAAMPLFTREAGRRLNSLAQGGLPVDVAETVAWLASPGSAGVNGNVVRVCGQSMLGA